MFRYRILALVLASNVLISCQTVSWSATTTISGNTTWTPSSIPTAGVTYNSTNQTFTLNNSLVINSGALLRVLQGNGVDGANFTLNVPNSGLFKILSNGTLDLSAQSGNGRAGNLLVNMLGSTATIQMDGLIRANGLGSGRGGNIVLNASQFTSLNGSIQAMGGSNGGLGGTITLQSTVQPIVVKGSLRTDGLSSASQNLITIQANSVSNEGVLQANGTNNSGGGTIQLIATNGKLRIENGGSLSAQGAGSGLGGTIDLRASQGSNALAMANTTCTSSSCVSNNSTADIQLQNTAVLNVSGGNNSQTGLIRIGRSSSGSISQDFSQLASGNFVGAGTVQIGNDSGYTQGISINNYNASTHFNGSNPLIAFVSTTGGLSATTNNNFDRVSITNTTGTVNLSDTTGGLYVTSLSSSGSTTLSTQNQGNLTLENASTTGNTTVNASGNAILQSVIQNGTLNVTSQNGSAVLGSSSGLLMANGNVSVNSKDSASFNNYFQTGTLTVNTNNGNITLGGSNAPVNINGNVAFNAGSADVIGYGQFNGTLSGSAGRIGLEASNGDLISSGLTATSSNGWWGASDESMILVTNNGRILGSGFYTTGAADMRLQAGNPNSLNAGNAILVSNLNAGQNLRLFASGDSSGNGSGLAISVGGNSAVAGHITASGLNSAYQFAGTNGHIDIALASGDLKTALIWTKGKHITLTANNGNILQDSSIYNFSALRGNTLTTEPALGGGGNITLSALGGGSRYINTGGFGYNITAKASGDSNGNGGGNSVQLFGRAYGNLSVTNPTSGNVTGNVFLGTALGDPNDLSDVNTVMDIDGATLVKANGTVNIYGSTGGPVVIMGKSVTGQLDKGNLNIGQLSTTTTSGTGISLSVLQGRITGGNLSTAGNAKIYLQAGSQTARDKNSYIDLSNVITGGQLNTVVTGSTTGTSSGSSVRISGYAAGGSTASTPNGGPPLGSVSMP